MLKSIEEELEDCRKRFEGVGVGALVWCCHHSIELEMLTELPEARIAYIMREKSVDERARRLHEFAPLRGELHAQVIKARAELNKASAEYYKASAEYYKASAELNKARAEYDKARAEYDKARAELNKAAAEWDKVCAGWDKARAEWDKARAEWSHACAEHDEEISELHRAEVPDTAWNGASIFSEEELDAKLINPRADANDH